MPRILRVLNRLNLGGPTINAAYLTKYLADPFHTVLAAGQPQHHEAGSDFILDRLGLPVERVPEMVRPIAPAADFRAYRALKRLIQREKPHIVHTHASKSGTLGRLAARSQRVPVIVHTFHGHWFHSYFSPAKTRVLMAVERRLSRLSTAVVAISPSQARDLTDTYRIAPPEKVRVIPLGLDVERFQTGREPMRAAFRRQFHIPEDHVLLVHVGRFVPVKNQTLVLRAFARLREQTKVPVSLCLTGDGPRRQALLDMARELSLPVREGDRPGTERVIFTSWIQDVERVHAAGDLGVLTSHNEGTPLSLIESQAAGRPVVSTRVGGVEDCVQAGATGFLIPPDDVDALVEHLKLLVEDPELRAAMGARAEAFATQKFHYRRLVSDMTELYRELCALRGVSMKAGS